MKASQLDIVGNDKERKPPKGSLTERGRRKALYRRGTAQKKSVRKYKYSVSHETREELGLQQRYVFRKEKSAVERDTKKSWSGIEVEGEFNKNR